MRQVTQHHACELDLLIKCLHAELGETVCLPVSARLQAGNQQQSQLMCITVSNPFVVHNSCN